LESLRTSTTLRSIHLSDTLQGFIRRSRTFVVGEKDELFNAIYSNLNLTSLTLKKIEIDGYKSKMIAKMVYENRLKYLDLSFSKIKAGNIGKTPIHLSCDIF